MDITVDAEPKIRVCSHVWEKIAGWRDATNLECSGIGLVRRKDNIFTVYDVFLPVQIGTFGHTDLNSIESKNSLSEIMMRVLRMKQPTENIRLWWHTHPTFDVFWSAEDEDTARRFAGLQGDYTISIVTNQKNLYRCRLDVFRPFYNIKIDNIEMEFIKGHKVRDNNWKYQVNQKVKEQKFEFKQVNNPYNYMAQDDGSDYTDWCAQNGFYIWKDGQRVECSESEWRKFWNMPEKKEIKIDPPPKPQWYQDYMKRLEEKKNRNSSKNQEIIQNNESQHYIYFNGERYTEEEWNKFLISGEK